MAGLLSGLREILFEEPQGRAGPPTWRIRNRWTKPLYASRPLTGYHLFFHQRGAGTNQDSPVCKRCGS